MFFLTIIESVDEIFQLSATELVGANAEDEADGIHEVGFSGAVGADDGGEIVERADLLESFVGFEVGEFQAEDFAWRVQRWHDCGGGRETLAEREFGGRKRG